VGKNSIALFWQTKTFLSKSSAVSLLPFLVGVGVVVVVVVVVVFSFVFVLLISFFVLSVKENR
jgi:hypothetical protein